MASKTRFIFFGSSRFSVIVLDELERAGFMPEMVVTSPDKPQGRKLTLTPTPVKDWAIKRGIKVYDPAKLDAEFINQIRSDAKGAGGNGRWDLFVVASYGKILPVDLIDMPTHKTLNVHPSLLPKYRGASPLQSAMLDDEKKTGVTIMRIDKEMDHGTIISQEEVSVDEWPIYEEFEESMAKKGGSLLAKTIPDWIAGKISEREQDHSAATYSKKIVKEDGLIDLSGDAYANFRKIQAYHEWPGAYFFIDRLTEKGAKKLRIKITSASYRSGDLVIERVIPEGGKEMAYGDFKRGYKTA